LKHQVSAIILPQSNMLSSVRSGFRLARPAMRAVSSVQTQSPWGSDHWRHDKLAFIDWCKMAMKDGASKEKREFYGFVSLAFGDVDTDKDGFITPKQFDRLLEKIAAVPRRYGLAPLSTESYDSRLQKHTEVFNTLDAAGGPARGVLALDQVVEWTFEHVAAKVGQIPAQDVGLYHVENYTEEQYIGFIERAVSNPGSYEHASFYNFILNCFVEADAESKGRITYEQFHKLLDRAAVVPRHFGLAPDSVDESVRKQMFKDMELSRGGKPLGFVTFRVFWEWTVKHVAKKIELQKAGKGWRENH